MAGWWVSQFDGYAGWYVVKDHIPGQGIAAPPFLGLSWWQAAIVFLGQSRWAATATELLAIISVGDFPLMIVEVAVNPYFGVTMGVIAIVVTIS